MADRHAAITSIESFRAVSALTTYILFHSIRSNVENIRGRAQLHSAQK